jgi:hypothetical protein
VSVVGVDDMSTEFCYMDFDRFRTQWSNWHKANVTNKDLPSAEVVELRVSIKIVRASDGEALIGYGQPDMMLLAS